ncbi:MAG: DUF6671 family protein [Oculatellaceae cyanobacterium bins.114]|nr:DUF6671 family protein [Oculatellaceae cyanobacterium bins.114]
MSSDRFRGRVGVIATMHGKEAVMAPLLEQELGIRATVPKDFNTDVWGTFTRDVKRPGDQLQTVWLKAQEAIARTGITLAFASEGSFGPHPVLPFVGCDREIVMLVDRDHDLKIVGQAISTDTNYAQKRVDNLETALAFATQVGFPQHGLIAMPDPHTTDPSIIIKGIATNTQLEEVVTTLLQQFGQAHLETDMRAMHNPTRMKVIAEATQDLLNKISQTCPQCGTPGFNVVNHKLGLPCALCAFPTGLTLADIQQCSKCGFTNTVYFPKGQETADPAQCGYCNP